MSSFFDNNVTNSYNKDITSLKKEMEILKKRVLQLEQLLKRVKIDG